MQLGYKCYLKVTERTVVQKLLKNRIKELTKLSKESGSSLRFKTICKNQKRCIAKIYSKMEELFPDESK